jgi:hypothetical protein
MELLFSMWRCDAASAGEPFTILSVSIHYFRIRPELWRDRLERVAAMGANAIQFYIPWCVLHAVRQRERRALCVCVCVCLCALLAMLTPMLMAMVTVQTTLTLMLMRMLIPMLVLLLVMYLCVGAVCIRACAWMLTLLSVSALCLVDCRNFHEAQPGAVDFSGDRNVTEFLSIAHSVGLVVLLRAGPYVCGEWTFGGLPWWLLNDDIAPQCVIRTSNPTYIRYVDAWWAQLMPVLRPMLYVSGGPIVMVQIENEYGSYGDVQHVAADRDYMVHLATNAQALLGTDVVLYTTDGGDVGYLQRVGTTALVGRRCRSCCATLSSPMSSMPYYQCCRRCRRCCAALSSPMSSLPCYLCRCHCHHRSQPSLPSLRSPVPSLPLASPVRRLALCCVGRGP